MSGLISETILKLSNDSMNTIISSITSWLLLRIYSDPGLAERIRAETALFAKVSQPTHGFAIPEPPSLGLDAEGLTQSCPLLKACYYECLRLDTSPVLVSSVRKNVVLTKPRKDLFGAERPASYRLKVGEMLAIPLRLHHYDPQEFDFNAERFFVPGQAEDGATVMDPSIPLPWAGAEGMLPGRELIEPLILALVAGFLALWDFKPLESGQRAMHQAAPNFLGPVEDVRVRVRRRALSLA